MTIRGLTQTGRGLAQTMAGLHVPVMTKEVVEYLNLTSNKNVIDCTLGDGGHAEAILRKIAPNGKLLGIDADQGSIARARKRLSADSSRTIFAQGNFRTLKSIVAQHHFGPVSGILLDLGWSSSQFEESGRGFSFLRDEPLDMRFDQRAAVTAADIINTWRADDLQKIFRLYGEELEARRIAEAIIVAREVNPIRTTSELSAIIEKAKSRKKKNIHPATQVFQALRIAVNDELGALKEVLPQATDILLSGGRLVIITFHSIEDRVAKRFIYTHPSLASITKKPIIPSHAEVAQNPRSRSAKLRAAIKI